jgi:hypothetical protein
MNVRQNNHLRPRLVATSKNRRGGLCVGTQYRAASRRRGGVYIAVLGSAMIIALLGMCALIGQRIENRLVVASTDIRQAQLNANTAVESALLTMKQDVNWRTNYSNGNWFTNRSTGTGTCTANVVDPIDGSLSNNPDDPLTITGIGYSGQAQQRIQVTIDPRKTPLSCLRSAVAAGGNITLNSNTLRTNGLITANQVSSSSAQVYGSVQATAVSGSTYNGTTTQIASDKRPTMPDWTSAFNYYRTNGTAIDINSLPTSTPNLGQNVGIENGTTSWTGTPPLSSLGTSSISQDNTAQHSGTNSLKVQSRASWTSGAIQRIDSFVKPGGSYDISAWVYIGTGAAKNFCVTLYTKGTDSSSSAQSSTGPTVLVVLGALNVGWTKVSATLTAPAWSGDLEYAFIKIAGADSLNTAAFNIDDLDIRESITGRLIYRQVLGPGVNPFGSTNSEGVYWINCNGNRLIIEHSRIVGTLLIVNPGANSCVNDGPIAWSPAVAGYPALLVDSDNGASADFAINATNHVLSEKDDGVNYNPSGAAHDELGTNSNTIDIYRSQIRGLIAIRHDLTYQNRALLRGPVIVGNNVTSSSGELEVNYLSDSLLSPPSGFWSYSYPRRTGSTRKVVLP